MEEKEKQLSESDVALIKTALVAAASSIEAPVGNVRRLAEELISAFELVNSVSLSAARGS